MYRRPPVMPVIRAGCAAALLLVVACRPDEPVSPAVPVVPIAPGPASPATVMSLRAQMDTIALFVGDSRTLDVIAYDAKGVPLSTENAQVDVSGGSFGTRTELVPVPSSSPSEPARQKRVHLQFVSTGRFTVTVTLNGLTTSLEFEVGVPPRESMSVAIDSFYVVTYTVPCGEACNRVVYAPLLKLRNTGTELVRIMSVEYLLGPQSTGACLADVPLSPGTAAFVNGVSEDLWANDLIFVDPEQVFSDSPAGARVVVREGDGTYRTLFAWGKLQERTAETVLPPMGMGWSCR